MPDTDTELEAQALEVTNTLLGLPTKEALKQAYLDCDFDRKKVAEHFGISQRKLNEYRKALLGNAELPSGASYVRQWNEVKWFTGKFPAWTHVPPNPGGPAGTFYKSH